MAVRKSSLNSPPLTYLIHKSSFNSPLIYPIHKSSLNSPLIYPIHKNSLNSPSTYPINKFAQLSRPALSLDGFCAEARAEFQSAALSIVNSYSSHTVKSRFDDIHRIRSFNCLSPVSQFIFKGTSVFKH